MVKVPLHGEMASACFHRSLALVASNFSTSLPGILSDQPLMTGEVKSLAGVRVAEKILSVISLRSIDCEMAARRRAPSAPEKCGRFCAIVNDWKIAAGWFTARSPRSILYLACALSGTASVSYTHLTLP